MENKRKIIYFDMDGVVADFEGGLHERHPELHRMHNGSKEKGEAIDFLCENKSRDIFRVLKPMYQAVDIVTKLADHFDVYFLSTPMWLLPESYMDKRIWLEQHFGAFAYKRLILSHNKGLLKGDYLIDDRIKNGVDGFEGEHIHYGQHAFPDLQTVYDYIMKKEGIPFE